MRVDLETVTNYVEPHFPVEYGNLKITLGDLRSLLEAKEVRDAFESYSKIAAGLPEFEEPQREALLQTLGYAHATQLNNRIAAALFRHLSNVLVIDKED